MNRKKEIELKIGGMRSNYGNFQNYNNQRKKDGSMTTLRLENTRRTGKSSKQSFYD